MPEWFVKGGPVMWPILGCSVVALTAILERAIFWWNMRRGSSQEHIRAIIERTERGDYEAALRLASASSDPTAQVLAAGLSQRGHVLRESLEAAADDTIEDMKRGLSVLDTVITLAPLLGILGTVLGIIESFDLLGKGGIQDPKAVTSGIAEALITTAAGLVVAISTLVPFNYFVGRVQRATKRMENALTQFEMAYRQGMEANDAAQ